jgi:hypothetical protein
VDPGVHGASEGVAAGADVHVDLDTSAALVRDAIARGVDDGVLTAV